MRERDYTYCRLGPDGLWYDAADFSNKGVVDLDAIPSPHQDSFFVHAMKRKNTPPSISSLITNSWDNIVNRVRAVVGHFEDAAKQQRDF